MSHSEFPSGISAVTASQFGGGQSYFAEHKPVVVKDELRPDQKHPSHDEKEDSGDEAEEQPNPDEPSPNPPEPEFEPTYDLSKGVEHHQHVGLLLDLKL
jgi:hypothetical protein